MCVKVSMIALMYWQLKEMMSKEGMLELMVTDRKERGYENEMME
jgi:hypothetical protein